MTRAERNIKWIEHYCKVPEGKFVGQKVVLRPFQKDIMYKIYDNEVDTRMAIISMGRKNAKTAFVAFLLLLHIVGPEATPNSQLYSAAQSREQASLLFNYASKIIRFNVDLSLHTSIRDSYKQITCPAMGTVYKALSSEATTAFGLSPVFIVHDELGQVKGPISDLYDALETGAGAHERPLSIVISTQAPDDSDLLSILIDDARLSNDPSIVLVLYECPDDDSVDIFSEEAIKLANPAYGDFLNSNTVLDQAAKAKRMPSKESQYRNLVLNQRCAADKLFVARSVWKDNSGEIDESVFYESDCYLALDLSSKVDLTSLTIAAKDKSNGDIHTKTIFYSPKFALSVRIKRDKAPYDLWAKQGYLKLTPGKAVDYDYVSKDIIYYCKEFQVAKIVFDRWRIDNLKQSLDRMSAELQFSYEYPLEAFGQGYKDMSPALESFEELLLNSKIRHGNNPILNWCASNAIVVKSPAGDRKLDKNKSSGRIDGMVTMTMAIGSMSKSSGIKIISYSRGEMYGKAS